MKARARAAGEDIIDLGMGNPDLPTPPHIVAKLVEAAGNPRTHGYSASRGIPGLRKALAGYYAAPLRRRRSIPRARSIVTLGSKEGLANLAQAITCAGRHRPGAQPQLSDPSLRLHHRRRLGAPHPGAGQHPLDEFLPALERAVRHTVPKPIGAGAELSVEPDGAGRRPRLLRAPIVDFCKRQGIWILSRPRLCRDLFRRRAAAVGAAGAGRAGHRRRVHLDEQDLLDGGLAHRLRRRQQDADPRR